MLDINFIRENKEVVDRAQKLKKVKKIVNLDELLSLHEDRKSLSQKRDELNAQKNAAAKERNIEEGTRIKAEAQAVEAQYNEVEKKYISMMLSLPNVFSPDTPEGKDDTENKVIRNWGDKPAFDFEPKEHYVLGEALGVIDKETAGDVSGSRFGYLKGDLALLQFALIQFCLSTLTDQKKIDEIVKNLGLDINPKAFTAVVPPVMVKTAVYNRMARLEPSDDKYKIEGEDLWLAGSAEHSLGPMYMDTMLEEEALPIRMVGYSTAFRKEAGTYGKDTNGILRMHQFDKLEMETFSLPEYSIQEQDLMVGIQEYFMQTLKLPYQVVAICTGDMGIPDYRQMDIETWMPGQNKYRETHTSDLMTSFQSRRLNTRVKRVDGGKDFVHMNDATAFAIGRTLIAIMENYQQADGTVKIPEALQPFMGGKTEIGKIIV
jgi:seryl-tRNA synthetase